MSDEKIRQDVLESLLWSSRVNATHIGVSVRAGIVTLTGHVETFAEKLEAERLALAVRGVKGVAEDIVVRLPQEKKSDDSEIADRAARLLAWDSRLGGCAIQVKVERGWLTLLGEARNAHQRQVAFSDVKRLSGIVGVTDAITLPSAPTADDVRGRVERALERQSALKDADLRVSEQMGVIVLSGDVPDWPSRAVARNVAWNTTGVREVIDNLRIAS